MKHVLTKAHNRQIRNLQVKKYDLWWPLNRYFQSSTINIVPAHLQSSSEVYHLNTCKSFLLQIQQILLSHPRHTHAHRLYKFWDSASSHPFQLPEKKPKPKTLKKKAASINQNRNLNKILQKVCLSHCIPVNYVYFPVCFGTRKKVQNLSLNCANTRNMWVLEKKSLELCYETFKAILITLTPCHFRARRKYLITGKLTCWTALYKS